MTYIDRTVERQIEKALKKNKVIVLYGPRQTGKTTLLRLIEDDIKAKLIYLNGDLKVVQEALSSQNLETIKNLIGDHDLVVIDEAQRIENIGINLKIIHDALPQTRLIATGSSSFELANKIREPLTGRTTTFMLYPLSVKELQAFQSPVKTQESLENYLIFGQYPEVVTLKSAEEKRTYLQEVVEANLYKDILELENVKNPKVLKDLLVLLALQIGQEVSLTELGSNLKVAKETVKRYLDLLEKAFIIANLRGFSRNLGKEVTKNSKYYFIDLGVRNTVINNFNPLHLRTDTGMMWENFLFMERLKYRHYHYLYANMYFWRTYDQKEIDLIEERDGKLFAYEFKWKKSPQKAPKDFIGAYQNAEFKQIHRDNFLSFIT